MHYPSSENKGADQLCSYCTADLRLCFRIGKNPVFSRCGSYSKGQAPETNLEFGFIQGSVSRIIEVGVFYGDLLVLWESLI